ncbi:hypothetical protein [Pedobacter hartonius]|uniref:O-Antigen ligase n=1 Tax=Pedobacter hartonius TaxID=425514 RepID=A0A1H4FTA1_9SPHI|nr:hypothetical protein [Pedobacter hartonius]SEA99752.1 hypothetical protein SAMN05443550_10878 [Pedobacter hartonius]
MKFDYLALILTFLFGILICIFPPFVASVYVPVYVRFPLLFILTVFFLTITIRRKKFVFRFGPYICFFIFEIIYWAFRGNIIIGEASYFIMYVMLASGLWVGIYRINGGKVLMGNMYILIVIAFSILSILSFIAYNLDLLPYTLETIGEDGFYTNFHNVILGYISIRKFEFGTLGRVCGYLLEPSYLAWFLSVNFFMIDGFLKKRKHLLLARVIVLLGALATCSTMAWVVIPIVLFIKLVYKIMELMKISPRLSNILFSIGFVITLAIFFAFVPKQNLVDSLGTSSADDREDRAGTSFLIIANSSVPDLLFGFSPGYIEKNVGKGESNQIVKLIVETGLISTILILTFVVKCSYRSKYFMIANLLFLNSVVILLTPLFILNLLVCKWNDE